MGAGTWPEGRINGIRPDIKLGWQTRIRQRGSVDGMGGRQRMIESFSHGPWHDQSCVLERFLINSVDGGWRAGPSKDKRLEQAVDQGGTDIRVETVAVRVRSGCYDRTVGDFNHRRVFLTALEAGGGQGQGAGRLGM